MSLRAAVLALALLARVAGAAELVQSPLPGDPMAVSIHRLANGLTIYLSPNPQEPRVYSSIAVRAGGKDDPDDSTGIAHYLEHMLFKGSRRLGTLDYEKEKSHLDRIAALYEELFVAKSTAARAATYRRIDEESVKASRLAIPNELDRIYAAMGIADANAGTSEEATTYVSEFPANRAEAWATVETDRFAQPVFRLFQSELEAVYEEKNRSLDSADERLGEALEARLYKEHPYGQRTILGSIEHLKNPSLAKMRSFYERRYVPANMAIALSGDFDRGRMLELLERRFGAWKKAPAPERRRWPLPPPKGAERVEVRHEAEERLVIAWPTAPRDHPDEEALEVMDMVMDNAQAGLINLRLNQAQRVKGAGSYPAHYNDAGSWRLWASPKKGQTLEEAEKLLLETVEALKAGEFGEEDVRAVITDFEVSEKRRLESNAARSGMMAASFTHYSGWPRVVAKLERLRRVTKADVVAVAKKYLGPDRVVACRRPGKPAIPQVEKPRFSQVEIDPSRESAFAREVLELPTVPIEPRFLEEGRDYRRLETEWGRLYVASNPVNDLFALTFVFDRGYRHERTLCEALELLELSGEGALDADEFKRRLYRLGSAMSVDCGEQQSSVSLTGLESHLEATLELAKSRFEAPNTSSGTLRDRIEVTLGEQQDNKKSQGYAYYALSELAKKGRRSSVLQQLTPKELSALELGALHELVKGFFGYRRDALYVGRRPADTLGPLLAWGAAPYRAPAPYEPRRWERGDRPRVLIVPREQVQANVGMFAADEVYDPARAVDYLYYNIYMGGGGGVIYQEMREARSLAYSSSGGYGAGERLGDENILWGSVGTQADKTIEAAGLLSTLLKSMPLAEARFLETKRAIEQDFRTSVVTFREVPGTIRLWELRGILSDPRPERFKRALAYEPKDLAAFARRFEGRPLVIYVLGPAGTIDRKGLAGLGEVAELKVDDLFPY